MVFDYFASAATLDGSIIWGPGKTGALKLIHTFEEAQAMFELSRSPDAPYIDIHAWRFTPSSFRNVLHDLNRLGMVKLTESKAFDTIGCEFFVSLSPDAQSQALDRLQVAKRVQRELSLATLD